VSAPAPVPAPTILVVEDDVDTREMLERFLQLEGFDVRTAINGQAALASLRAHGRPCVILLDLMMPVMDGWQFREVQRRDPALARIPVVVVTAAGPKTHIPAIDADGWLAKPVDLEQLLSTIGPFCAAAGV
jgi:CheY-like chemotaxis protein